jgi:hypothetical protein
LFSTVQVDKFSREVEELHAKLKAAQESALQYNARECLFGLPATDYTVIKALFEYAEPFYQFWTSAAR